MRKVQLDCDAERAQILAREVGKVRTWLTGWHAGRSLPGTYNLDDSIPGEQALRTVQCMLDDSAKRAREKEGK